MIICFAGVIVSIVTALIWGWPGFLTVAGITVILVLSPIEGLEDRELVSEIPLIALKRVTSNGNYFIEKTRHKATYAFDNRSAYEINFEAYEEKTVRGLIKVYESKECDAPVLRTFKRQPVRTGAFAIAPFSVIEYVFLLPKGTVIYKKKKKEENKPKVV